MNEAELKEMFVEADRRGDRETAMAIMDKLELMKGDTLTIPEGAPVSPNIPMQETPEIQAPGPQSLAGGLSAVIEPAATVASGMVAEPVAGLAGIATLAFDDVSKAAENIKAVKEALTFLPPTKEGMQSLKKVAAAIQPAGEAIKAGEEALGDVGYHIAGPVGGAIGETTITAALSATGLPAVRRALTLGKTKTDTKIKDLLGKAAPSSDDLKTAAKGLYDELDNSGVILRDGSVDGLIAGLEKISKKAGVRPILHPKSSAAINAISEMKGSSKAISEIDEIREIAGTAAASIEPKDARVGSMMKDKIDDYLDGINASDIKSGSMKDISGKFNDARQMYHRAKKSELIEEAVNLAEIQKSGFENGLRIQFGTLAKRITKNKLKGFTADEIAAIKAVEKGTTLHNLAASLGKLGFGEKNVSNVVGSGFGIYGGASLGGPVGAVAVPLVGTLSGILAKKLTKGRADFADSVVRAGKSGDNVAKAYMNKVPEKDWNPKELMELLMRPGMSLEKLKSNTPKNPTPRQKLRADAIFLLELVKKEEE